MKLKLTAWFPGHIKPVRKGVYQQKAGLQDMLGYQYWSGLRWYGWVSTIEGAYAARKYLPVHASHQNDDWRGVLG